RLGRLDPDLMGGDRPGRAGRRLERRVGEPPRHVRGLGDDLPHHLGRRGDQDVAFDAIHSSSLSRAGRISGATRAPTSATPAPPTAIAGPNPSVPAAALSSPPWAEKTATPTAMPNTAPSRWVMLFTPDAMPVASGSTAPST